jgi:hypothetical protein
MHIRSVLGTLLVVLGLYAYLWGKGAEAKLAAAAAVEGEEAGHQRQGGGHETAASCARVE